MVTSNLHAPKSSLEIGTKPPQLRQINQLVVSTALIYRRYRNHQPSLPFLKLNFEVNRWANQLLRFKYGFSRPYDVIKRADCDLYRFHSYNNDREKKNNWTSKWCTENMDCRVMVPANEQQLVICRLNPGHITGSISTGTDRPWLREEFCDSPKRKKNHYNFNKDCGNFDGIKKIYLKFL